MEKLREKLCEICTKTFVTECSRSTCQKCDENFVKRNVETSDSVEPQMSKPTKTRRKRRRTKKEDILVEEKLEKIVCEKCYETFDKTFSSESQKQELNEKLDTKVKVGKKPINFGEFSKSLIGKVGKNVGFLCQKCDKTFLKTTESSGISCQNQKKFDSVSIKTFEKNI